MNFNFNLLDSMEWNYIGESGIEIIARNSHSLGIVKDDVNNRSYLVVYGGASPEHGPLGDTIYAEIPYDPTTIGYNINIYIY